MASPAVSVLQWGPVVVTGISGGPAGPQVGRPVSASMGSGRGDRNQQGRTVFLTALLPLQWGPVVVTGIRVAARRPRRESGRFNGVRSCGRGDRNQHHQPRQRVGAASASMGSGRGDRNQIAPQSIAADSAISRFNGVRSW